MKTYTHGIILPTKTLIYTLIFFLSFYLTPQITSADEMPAKGISFSPSTVEYQGDIYVFMQGKDENKRLEYKIFRDGKWSEQRFVPNVSLIKSPAAVVYNNKIFVFHQQSDGKGNIRYTEFDGEKWTEDFLMNEDIIDYSPKAVVYKGKLYVFHNGYKFYDGRLRKNELWYRTFDGNNWGFYERVEGPKMVGEPFPIVYNDKIYVYYQSDSKKEELWFNSFNGSTWTENDKVDGIKMKGYPAALNYKEMGKMYLFTKSTNKNTPQKINVYSFDGNNYRKIENSPIGANTDWPSSPIIYNDKFYLFYDDNNVGHLKYANFNNNGEGKWTSPLSVPIDPVRRQAEVRGITREPSVVEFNGAIYAFMQGRDENKLLQYRVLKDNYWSPQVSVPNVKMSNGPGAVVYDNRIFVFFQDENKKGKMQFTTFDGKNWRATSGTLEGKELDDSPKAVAYKDKIYVFHRKKGKGELWYFTFDGKDWSDDIKVENTDMSYTPAPVVYNGRIYVYHHGKKNNKELWFQTFDGSSWWGDQRWPQIELEGSPNAVFVNAGWKTYIFSRSTNKNTKGIINVHSYDGYKLKTENKSYVAQTDQIPAGIQSGNRLYIYYNDMNSNDLKYIKMYDNKWETPITPPGKYSLEGAGLLDKKFGTFTFPGTFHSFISSDDFKRYFHETNYLTQLDNGIRYLEIDLNYWKNGHPAGGIRSGTNIMYNYTDYWWPDYLSLGNGEKNTLEALSQLNEWLNAHPNEIIVLRFKSQTHIKYSYVEEKLRHAHLDKKMFVGDGVDFTQLTPRDILKAGKQIIAYGIGAGSDLKELESGIAPLMNKSKTRDVFNIDDINALASSNDSKAHPFYDIYLSGVYGVNRKNLSSPFPFGSKDLTTYLNDYTTAMDIILNGWKKSAIRPFSIQFGFTKYGDALDIVNVLNREYNSVRGKTINLDGETIPNMQYEVKYYDFDEDAVITGNFDFPVKKGTTTVVTPIHPTLEFDPPSFTYTNTNGEDASINFTIKQETDNNQLKDASLNNGFFTEGVGPTPFADYIDINIHLPQDGNVILQWYTIKGELVKTSSLGYYNKGQHRIKHHPQLPTGSYVYKCIAGPKVMSGAIVRE